MGVVRAVGDGVDVWGSELLAEIKLGDWVYYFLLHRGERIEKVEDRISRQLSCLA